MTPLNKLAIALTFFTILTAGMSLKIYNDHRSIAALQIQKTQAEQESKNWKKEAGSLLSKSKILSDVVKSLDRKVSAKNKLIASLKSEKEMLVDSIKTLQAKMDVSDLGGKQHPGSLIDIELQVFTDRGTEATLSFEKISFPSLLWKISA